MTGPGYVYVIAFGNGTVKVGRTQNTSQRLGAHKTIARKLGLTVTDEWLSPLHAEWRANEDKLKAIAADLGGTAHSKEYFSGVSFEAIAEKARELPFTAAEAVAGQAGSQRVAPQAVRDTAATTALRERAIRDTAKRRKVVATAEVDELADIYLDLGFGPEYFRNFIPPIAWAMEGLLHEEEKILRTLSAAVKRPQERPAFEGA